MSNSHPEIIASNPTVRLINAIGSPGVPEEKTGVVEESLQLYQYAVKNKVGLLYLDTLKRKNRLNKLNKEYDAEHSRYLKYLNGITRVVNILEEVNIEYAVFKTIKPYPAVLSDIDVILTGDDDVQYTKTAEALLRAQYTPYVQDNVNMSELKSDQSYKKAAELSIRPTFGVNHVSPEGAAFIDPELKIDIDLRKEIAVSHVIYIDKNKLKEHIIRTSLPDGKYINTPNTGFDMTIIIAHALMERTFHLGEYYTFLSRISGMNKVEIDNFFSILEDNNLLFAGRAYTNIAAVLCYEVHSLIPEKLEYLLNRFGDRIPEVKYLTDSNLVMPARYHNTVLIRVLLEKLKEKSFSKSALRQSIGMLNPKLARLVIRHLAQ